MVAQKGKKKWFTVLTPTIFGEKELSEVPAFALEDLKGRLVEVTGQMLTGLPKDANRKYALLINSFKGEKALTIPVKYQITANFAFRAARKYKERKYFVFYPRTKDNIELRLKLQFLNPNKLHRSERGALLKKLQEILPTVIKAYDSQEIFKPSSIEDISSNLKKQLSEERPIEKILIMALSVRNISEVFK